MHISCRSKLRPKTCAETRVKVATAERATSGGHQRPPRPLSMSGDLKKVAQTHGCWPKNVRSFINGCASETVAIHTSFVGEIVWEISVDAKHAQWQKRERVLERGQESKPAERRFVYKLPTHTSAKRKGKGAAPTHANRCSPSLSATLFMVCLHSLLFCVPILFVFCFARAFLWMNPLPLEAPTPVPLSKQQHWGQEFTLHMHN